MGLMARELQLVRIGMNLATDYLLWFEWFADEIASCRGSKIKQLATWTQHRLRSSIAMAGGNWPGMRQLKIGLRFLLIVTLACRLETKPREHHIQNCYISKFRSVRRSDHARPSPLPEEGQLLVEANQAGNPKTELPPVSGQPPDLPRTGINKRTCQ